MYKKIYEFIDNKDILMRELEDIIYMEEGVWTIPGDDIYDMISDDLGFNVSEDFKIIANHIVDELNKRKIDPDYFIEGYNSIIKELTTI